MAVRWPERCAGCGLPPRQDDNGDTIELKVCSRCRSVAYHDVSCQKRHYFAHKAMCRKSPKDHASEGNPAVNSFRGSESPPSTTTTTACDGNLLGLYERSMPDRGAGLFAARYFAVGDVVSFTPPGCPYYEPMVWPVLALQQRNDRCVACFRRFSARNVRTLCHNRVCLMMACSSACRDVAVHELGSEIQVLEQWPMSIILPTAQLLFRLWKCQQKHSLDMRHHPIAMNDDELEHELAVCEMTECLLQATSGELTYRLPPPSDLRRQLTTLLSMIKCNSFTIIDDDGAGLGVGLYRTAYKLNHSCVPNAEQRFVFQRHTAPGMQVVTQRPIAAQDEVVIAYTDVDDYTDRREFLRRHYHFTCTCSKCQANA